MNIYFILLMTCCPFHKKIVSIVLTFSLKIIVRQFLNHFHKDYLKTNFNLTTKITLTIKKIVLRCTRYNIIWWSLSITCDSSMVFSGTPVFSTNKTDCHNITEILLKGAINTISHLPEQSSSFLLHVVSLHCFQYYLNYDFSENFVKKTKVVPLSQTVSEKIHKLRNVFKSD